MPPFDPAALARQLFAARAEGRMFPAPPPGAAPSGMPDAYQAQDALDALFRRHGLRPIGYKIAGTNPAARAHLRIDAPFHGRLYDGMASPSPASLAVSATLRVHEPEIALEIARDLPPAAAPFTAAAIEAATRAIRPAIEIIGTPLEPWTQAGAPNLAADNAAFGHWVFGAPVTDWRAIDLLDGSVTLTIDGVPRGEGRGRNVDDGPFGAAAWLANALAARGIGLKAGDHITTGAVMSPVPVQPGQHVRAEFGPLGTVELRMAG